MQVDLNIVSAYISDVEEDGFAKTIPQDVLKAALIALGAKEPDESALKSLSKYSNASKADGMRVVWSEDFSIYKKWAKAYVSEYEARQGISLPALKPSGIKTSGLIAFFGELTAYAFGAIDWETFEKYSNARRFNGDMWEQGRKEERIRVEVPTSEKPILLSSYPPEFPLEAWKFISNGFIFETDSEDDIEEED